MMRGPDTVYLAFCRRGGERRGVSMDAERGAAQDEVEERMGTTRTLGFSGEVAQAWRRAGRDEIRSAFSPRVDQIDVRLMTDL